MDKIIKILNKYDEKVSIEKLKFNLPIIIEKNYEVHKLILFGNDFILLIPKSGDIKISQVVGNIKLLKTMVDIPIIIFEQNITEYKKQKYCRIGQAYLSKKNLYIRNFIADISFDDENNSVEKFSPFTQFVYLHFFYDIFKEETLLSMSQKLNVSKNTISNATQELCKLELLECKYIAKNKPQTYKRISKKDFFNNAKPYFINPIKRNEYTYVDGGLESGINALAQYTFIAQSNTSEKAIYFRDKITRTKNEEYITQLWIYDPKPFNVNGCVDELSTYLIFKDSMDVRIKNEITKMEKKWLED